MSMSNSKKNQTEMDTSPSVMPLEVLIRGFLLEDYFDKNFLVKLNALLGDKYQLRIRRLEILLLDNTNMKGLEQLEEQIDHAFEEGETPETEENLTTISIPLDFRLSVPSVSLHFSHRNEMDYAEKTLLVSSNNENILKLLLDNYKEVLNVE